MVITETRVSTKENLLMGQSHFRDRSPKSQIYLLSMGTKDICEIKKQHGWRDWKRRLKVKKMGCKYRVLALARMHVGRVVSDIRML